MLCLQGFNQNHEMFQQRSATFRNKLKSKYDFVCPDAPYQLPNGNRAWYVYNEQSPLEYDWNEILDSYDSTDKLYGFDASKQLIQQILKDNPDITCVQGFSQGAAFLSILCAQGIIPDHIDVVFVAGFYPLKWSTTVQTKCKHRSIHVIGLQDEVIQPALCRRLAQDLFNEPTIQEHNGKHVIPRVNLTF